MRTVVPLCLLAALPCIAGDPPSAAATSPAAVARTLDGKEQQLERLYADYWRIQYRLEQGDTSVSDQEVESGLRAVFNDPAFLQALKASRFETPILQRRRELFLEAAADSQISTDASLAALVESIRKDGAAMRYEVGGQSLDRPELDNALGHSADRDVRKQAWFAMAKLTQATGNRIREAMKLRRQLALRFAGQDFTDLMLERRATNRRELMAWFDEIRTATDADYRALLARMQRQLAVEKVEPWDLQYYFSTLTPALEDRFGFEQGWARTAQVARRLGFDFDRLPVDVKITDITFGGYTMPVWYGKEIKMLVSRHTGVLFADTILHESGHALHFTFVQEPTFILKDNYPPPMDEGLGQTMSLMLFRPEIATSVYGLSMEEAQALRERRRQQTNYDMRSLMVQSEFEMKAYDDPDQDLDALYDRICAKYLDVDCHQSRTWGYDPYYAAIPLYVQNYVLAEMFAYQVHHALARKFGPEWGAAAGSYLHDKFLVRGGSMTLDQIMKEGTGEGLTAEYLIRAMQAEKPAAAAAPPHSS
jgi:oligoendopeptidase F